MTGFCDLPFLPATRRAPFTELTMRVKPRPNYEFQFKEAPPNVIHLADMDRARQIVAVMAQFLYSDCAHPSRKAGPVECGPNDLRYS